MTEFDSFADQLLEESKALLEKSKSSKGLSCATYLHASLLIAISALEAYINSIADELLVEPYRDKYDVHEQGLLLEKDVKFEKGVFVLSNGLKISRIADRIELLYYKFTGKELDGTVQWYSGLKQSIDLRNKLVHPKGNTQITNSQVELAISSVVNAVNELYRAVYKKGFPAFSRGISSKFTLA